MDTRDQSKRLIVLRAVSLLGGFAIIGFDLVMDMFAPEEPDMSAVRWLIGAASWCYFVATFVSAHFRRHADAWILLLVMLFTGSWLYNVWISQFSFSITITLFNVFLGCSLAFKDRRLIAFYLITAMAGVIALLLVVENPQVNPGVLVTALLVTSGLCYFVLGAWLESQETIERHQNDLQKTQVLAQVGGWTLTTQDMQVDLSDNAKSILGLDSEFVADWSSAIQIFHADYRQKVTEAVAAAKNKGERFDIEARCNDRGGANKWLRILGEVDATVSKQGLLRGMLQDISQQKVHEMELVDAKETAERALAARSQFLANMSHEIRTPMNGIIGIASLLRESELTDELRQMVETIYSSGESLLTILNDILDFSKIDSGLIELEQIPFSIRQVGKDAVDLLASRAREKHLQLTFNLDTAVPEYFIGDATRLRQVIGNLISNAVKFTAEGQVAVTIGGKVSDTDRFELDISVTDTGIGIAKEKQDTLFDAFTQADASTTREYGGTGLGLSISHQLVASMGGELTVESVLGEGSTFSARLTLTTTSETPATLSQVSRHAHMAESAGERGPRILLAEDNSVNHLVAEKMLHRLGLQADFVVTGLEAVNAAQDKRYDLIFMDIQMPEMDGLTATREIRAMPECGEPYIVALTANTMAGDAENYLAAGMNAHLAKPITLGALSSALDSYTQHLTKIAESSSG